LALDQPAGARAMLVPMAADRDPAVSGPALAMLGTLMLRDGATAQGYNLLRRAVEETVPPLLDGGHYLPCLDDRPRRSTPFAHYRLYREILEEIAQTG
jgi:hypothetical protein